MNLKEQQLIAEGESGKNNKHYLGYQLAEQFVHQQWNVL